MKEPKATLEKPAGRRYEEEILAEQVQIIYSMAPVGMAATLVNATIVFSILRRSLPEGVLIGWLALIWIVTFIRAGLLIGYRRRFQAPEAGRWGKRFIAGLVFIGIAWGSLGAFPFAGLSPTLRVFIAFVLGGMAAGAATTFSPLNGGYPAFAIPSLVPLVVHFFLLGEMMGYAMGSMLSIFGLLLWRLSGHNHRLTRTSLLLRFENREMIDSLRQAKDKAENLYRKLLAEVEAKNHAEAELKAHKVHLEQIVEVRTRDLQLTNEQLISAKHAAETANRAKGEFLTNMSHEIRTPLAGALGMINLVLEMEIGEEERRLLEMARRSSDSLLHLISDLLDFARLEAGSMRFERKPFPLSRAIGTSVEVVSVTAREKGLQLSWTLDPTLPEILEGDEGRLRQVLVNLLGNAVKFTDRGEIEVAVRPFCDSASPEMSFLLVSVRDTGIGISPDQMGKIFGKFIQVNSSKTRKYGGTGLGLALSRQIVEKMGGKIWAESRIGEGSTFYFSLPLDD